MYMSFEKTIQFEHKGRLVVGGGGGRGVRFIRKFMPSSSPQAEHLLVPSLEGSEVEAALRNSAGGSHTCDFQNVEKCIQI